MRQVSISVGALRAALIATCVFAGASASADVTPDEAAQLNTTLTPLGGERAANKDGRIPAWTGGYATPLAGAASGRRADPFPNEKPLLSITATNMDQYSDNLTDGQKAMLKRYADYRLDVYPTHRTAAAPQWVYDNTFKNATRAKLVGEEPVGAYGGIPFPIPKSGVEAIKNHILRWRGTSFHLGAESYVISADGRASLSEALSEDLQMPYYLQDGSGSKDGGDYWMVRTDATAPAMRAGEQILGRENLNPNKTQSWIYLTGQRRVRKIPNSCCDTPFPIASGVVSFDEVETFLGRTDRFDWKLLGKKEMYIPYNENKIAGSPMDQALHGHFLNPDLMRWELHRVWVVEATLKPGQRHQSPHARFYLDEDTWMAVLGDRWDARGQLWKASWYLPGVMSDFPAVAGQAFGAYDLISGSWFAANVNESFRQAQRYAETVFTPDAMAAESVR